MYCLLIYTLNNFSGTGCGTASPVRKKQTVQSLPDFAWKPRSARDRLASLQHYASLGCIFAVLKFWGWRNPLTCSLSPPLTRFSFFSLLLLLKQIYCTRPHSGVHCNRHTESARVWLQLDNYFTLLQDCRSSRSVHIECFDQYCFEITAFFLGLVPKP